MDRQEQANSNVLTWSTPTSRDPFIRVAHTVAIITMTNRSQQRISRTTIKSVRLITTTTAARFVSH
ncbi:hypothetical protein RMSM_07739 [Rhodopirellula maiorica SM1]|uniref:Uncharacterized protein n=1 Tax=Rhodopirellula maiorica SM1 TaxID=1265738 RepID=M5R8H4_9BACT|nr:hypothetical protein RMSM_07739 [Rhodopirellula maiorica SM1]